MRPTILLSALLVALSIGCKTAPIPDFDPVPVPTGLSNAEVETAILVAIIGGDINLTDSSGRTLPMEEIERLMTVASLTAGKKRGRWHLKRRRPNDIEAEYRRKNHRLLMDLRYDETAIRPAIIDSENLKQSGDMIHRNAIVWAEEFVGRLGGALDWAVRQAARAKSKR